MMKSIYSQIAGASLLTLLASQAQAAEQKQPTVSLQDTPISFSLDESYAGESRAYTAYLNGKAISADELMAQLERFGPIHGNQLELTLDRDSRTMVEGQASFDGRHFTLSGINRELSKARYEWNACLNGYSGRSELQVCLGSALVPDRYLIAVSKEVSADELAQMARGTAERYGARVDAVYESVFHGFALQIDKDKLAELKQERWVSDVYADGLAYTHTIQNPVPSWGMDRVDERPLNLDNRFTYQQTATGQDVYVIDSGLNAAHLDFTGRVGVGASFVGGSANTDCIGHGTHVAGTVLGTRHGLAKGATVHPVRVFGCTGSSATSTIVAGVNWVTANAGGQGVANMSLGGGANTAMDNAVQNSINSGVTYVVSAGNSNANACSYSPARVNDAITVGSTTINDKRSNFSNKGSCVDLFAPGSDITSAWHTGSNATNSISGTSMAAPHVAGIAALMRAEDPAATPADIMLRVISDATVGVLSSIGSGSPNLLAFWKNPCTDPVAMHDGSSLMPWFDGANCYVMPVPSGADPFIWSGNYYVEAKLMDCPLGSYDGANCYVMTKPETGFIYANNFYHQYDDCSVGSDDSANCYIASAPGGTSAFEWGGNFYTTALPGNVCPLGTYDGANCYVMTKPAGGFIYANNFYTTYDACTSGTDDGANCYLASAPAGTTAFEYDGNFYTTPTGAPTCPAGSYDGANCYIGTAPAGSSPFIWGGNFYYGD
ncbi:S8 family peptidase [Shewanella submarina]|uniref:S8 family peptidase n=1 Tax=Shewanella submarina TaxID=2016376 RepID=A0ABV7GFZ5_9GAMM|nr:S8 family peptidase [Shewanella submarina]MCL1037832.1 S8 family peptidase [Shewanella submarina]